MALTDINLTEQVKGTLPVANGGTGQATLAAAGIELTSNKGAASGYAGLNSSGLIVPAQSAKTVLTSSASSLTLTSSNQAYVYTGSTTSTWTLPSVSGNTGFILDLYNRGSLSVTLQRAGSDSIYQQRTTGTSVPLVPGGAMRLINDGTYWIVINSYQPAPLVFGGANAANTTTVAIPGHTTGDIIVIFVFSGANNTLPTAPSASGTVPSWVSIDSNATGTSSCSSATYYFVATANNHTSGTWTNVDSMIAAVVRSPAATPLGGHANSGGTASSTGAVAPSITETHADGTSILLHFFGLRPGNSWATWNAAPSGYTMQASSISGTWGGTCIDTKNITITDGSVTQVSNTSPSGLQYRGATVEILAY
jgi:hypothetical protein